MQIQILNSISTIILKCSKLELENKLLKRLDIADDSPIFYEKTFTIHTPWTVINGQFIQLF